MNRHTIIIVAAVAATAGVAAFFITATVHGETEKSPVAEWLDLSDRETESLDERDPGFAQDATELSDALYEARRALADLLEDPATPDDTIRQQVEKIIKAHSALERRATEHLLAIRDHLTPDQQKRLLGFCASFIREGAGRGPRHRQRRRFRGGRGESFGGGRGAGQNAGTREDEHGGESTPEYVGDE